MSPSWPASDEETSRPFTVRLDVTPTLSTVRLTNNASLQERELRITKLMEAGVLEPPYIEVKFKRLGIDVFCYRHRTKKCLATATPHMCGPTGGTHPKGARYGLADSHPSGGEQVRGEAGHGVTEVLEMVSYLSTGRLYA